MDEAARRKFIEQYDAMVAKAPAKQGRLPWDDLSFVETAINDHFSAANVIKILLDDQPSYFAHKEILFQILCMDVLAPGRKKYRKAAAAITMSDHLVKAYAKALKSWQNPALAEQVARVHIVGPVFFDQIYYPLGGIKAVRDAPTRKGWGIAVLGHTDVVNDVISLMSVFHHHYEHLRQDATYNRASLNIGSTLVKTMKQDRTTPLGKRTVKERWATFKDSVAFLYAAESIEHDGRTLLRCMIDDWLTFEDAEAVLPEWIARTKFVASEILMNFEDRETAQINLKKLPDTPQRPFNAPQFEPERAIAIAEAFRAKRRGRKSTRAK
ncbi:hypothetical protein [Methylopila sp. M107]|uniref:hypothetical protein n=1 Tax=Methylopila sp. M107 TaxID=1101190 RepID=UPI000362A351|nr:hypothetical protein [Methylopila sp. M107]